MYKTFLLQNIFPGLFGVISRVAKNDLVFFFYKVQILFQASQTEVSKILSMLLINVNKFSW